MVFIEQITPDKALVFKDVRLRALQDAPTAFSSTYAKESQFPDEEWRKRAVRWSSDGSAIFLALDGELPCGIVGAFEEEESPRRAQIISTWVDPAVRRTGVGKGLIAAVVDWATSRSIADLRLMVTSVNHIAIAFYERMGFRMTEKTVAYPNDPTITEFEMILRTHS